MISSETPSTTVTHSQWKFDVNDPPKFKLAPSANWDAAVEGKLADRFHVSETHLLSAPEITAKDLLLNPSNDEFSKVVFLLTAVSVSTSTGSAFGQGSGSAGPGCEGSQVFSDVTTGAGAINIGCTGSYIGKLVARDGAGAEVTVREWRFEIKVRDLTVPEYGPGGHDCIHGIAIDGTEMDDSFTCDCTGTEYTGPNCDVAPENSSSVTAIAVGVSCTAAAILLFVAILFWFSGNQKRARLARVQRAAKRPDAATKDELTAVLHEAIELDKPELITMLLENGADASSRSSVTGQLAGAALLQRDLQPNNADHREAVLALFAAHCVIDAQIGASIERAGSTAAEMVENALSSLAETKWRSRIGASTVAHQILDACRIGNVGEAMTVRLVESVLAREPGSLTVHNSRKVTPTDIAMGCTGCPEVERKFTVVVFEHYQILAPDKPMYKSPTAEVHEAVDLRAPDASRAQQRLALKLIAGPELWRRELEVRQVLTGATGGIVAALSAAVMDDSSSNSEQAEAIKDAMDYARSATTLTLPITTMDLEELGSVRRTEARDLMSIYSCAVCMPLADRNLLEIIQAERLAEEPMPVIRHTALKVATLIQSLHSNGVVHGDVKPKVNNYSLGCPRLHSA